MHFPKSCGILSKLTQTATTKHPGVAQLVARLTGGQEAVSSSLATRTKHEENPYGFSSCFFLQLRDLDSRPPNAEGIFQIKGRVGFGRDALRRAKAVSSSLATSKSMSTFAHRCGNMICSFRQKTANRAAASKAPRFICLWQRLRRFPLSRSPHAKQEEMQTELAAYKENYPLAHQSPFNWIPRMIFYPHKRRFAYVYLRPRHYLCRKGT